MMTRKHFDRMAWMIGHVSDRAERADLIANFIMLATEDNPRFDALRFADAVAVYRERFDSMDMTGE